MTAEMSCVNVVTFCRSASQSRTSKLLGSGDVNASEHLLCIWTSGPRLRDIVVEGMIFWHPEASAASSCAFAGI